ncbi:hypothetical protein [Celeribacter litoreus]|uniref:hypothetical protein n=1 Tax=Celeribacter litoreus TaxID=2876714 RepID=UPI001CC99CAC|nr:hypothetical protein [Celeribacter litoreus]MCA0045270.1 hypothetical protein [Celeribacter litoreus]
MINGVAYPTMVALLAVTQLSGCARPCCSAPEVSRAATGAVFDGAFENSLLSARGEEAKNSAMANADCAAAQTASIRATGFARDVRTNVAQEGGIWRADAVYTISPALPDGSRKLDTTVDLASCRDNGIPTV